MKLILPSHKLTCHVVNNHLHPTLAKLLWAQCADLTEEDVKPLKSKMADNLFEQVPVGVGGHGNVK